MGCDDEVETITEELCSTPGFLLTLSESGVLPLTLVIFLNLQKMSTASLRWTLMLTLGWVFAKEQGVDAGSLALFLLHGVTLLHLPMMPRKAGAGVLGFLALARWDGPAGAVLGKGVMLSWLTGVLTLAALWRLVALFVTAKATMSLTMVFPLVSRVFPAFTFSDAYFFKADGCPGEVAAKRRAGFDRLAAAWAKKWPKSAEMAADLKASFSDLRFASSNRVFLPFNRLLDERLNPATIVEASDGVDLLDVDGQRLLDISGSYGVNVAGTERYKGFVERALAEVGRLGLVLGPIHPLVADNIRRLKAISRKQEVSFHMSGTEAVMAAVRLCRYNTGRKLIVLFGGSYHGWWDGVQSTAGNERGAYDVLTLNDLDPWALTAIRLRRSEIACVVVNPLQAFHPNKPPPSDLVLASNSRDAGSMENEYQRWLVKLRAACTAARVVLLFDEVYTGFRLAPGGAQDYYKVEADMVVYGKTLGGGMPVGVVCGPSWLMNRTSDTKPLKVAYVIGTFSAAPLTVGCMNQFLQWVESEDAEQAFLDSRVKVKAFVEETNIALEKAGFPLRVASYASVWTMLFTRPGRYHWYLQYLLRDEGVQLSWVGTGRLNFSLDFTDGDFARLRAKLFAACARMEAEGWWWSGATKRAVGLRTGLEVTRGLAESLLTGSKATIG